MSSKSAPLSRRADIDKGWAWAALAALYLGGCIYTITAFMGGIINMALLEQYDGDKAMTALIGGMNIGLLCCLAPVASAVANILSCRVSLILCAVITTAAYVSSAFVDSLNMFLLTYGIIGGIGLSFGSITPVTIGYYFEKRRNGFMNLSQTVYGLSMLTASPLALYLIETTGLRNSLVIMGALMLHVSVTAMICKPSTIERELLRQRRPKHSSVMSSILHGIRNSFQLSTFKNVPFVLFAVSTVAWNVLLSVCLVHLPNYMRIKGSSPTQIGLQMVVFSFANTAGRLLATAAVASDTIDAMILHIGMLGVGGLVTIMFPFYSSATGGDVLFAIVGGVYTGGPNGMITSITADFVGVSRLAAASGISLFSCGIGYMIGPPIAGFAYGKTGSYDYSFYIAGGVNMVGCAFAMMSVILRDRKSGEEPSKNMSSNSTEITIQPNTKVSTIGNTKEKQTTINAEIHGEAVEDVELPFLDDAQFIS